MGFLSLYRKYRPRKFTDLVGQKHVVQTLKNALENNRIAHAYLFAGPRGTGKTSTAKVFAQALNCIHGPTPEPCGECEACKKIQSGQSIDVIEIDAASNRGIDEIRDLREKVKFYPSEGDYKVYIIDEVHMLTKGAFNALLKTLEEPPENVVFILATTEPHQVISTILSRCQRFDFSLLSIHDIQGRLEYICQEEGVEYEGEAVNIIAYSSNGGLRDAISILDQAISYTNGKLTADAMQKMLGKVDKEVLSQFIEYIVNYNSAEALKLVNQLIDRGNGVSRFVSDLIEHIRELLLIKECGINSGILEYPLDRLELLQQESQIIDLSRLIRVIDILTEIEQDLKSTSQPRLILEIGVVKMTSPDADRSLEGLEARLAELEYKLRELVKDNGVKSDVDRDYNNKVHKVPAQHQRVNRIKTDKYNNSSASELDQGLKQVNEQVNEEEGLSIDQVRKTWPVILKQIKEENISAQAFLIEGKPIKVEDDIVYIQFPEDKSFHKKGAEKERNLINKVFNKVLSQSCDLRFVIADNNTKVEENTKKEPEEIESSSENLVKKVVEFFDGEIIKVNHDVLKK